MEQQPLDGYTVGVTAERKAEELGGLLERRGAQVRYAAAMHTIALPEDGELAVATQNVLAAPVDYVVAITGVGFRGWLDAAEQSGVGAQLWAHLRGARLLARGAKARGAIRGAELVETWTAPAEESADVLDYLRERGVRGCRIVVQLHGDPMPDFQRGLRELGAEVLPVAVYRWTDPVDLDALDQLVDAVLAGTVHALPFTSAPAVKNLLDRADRTARGEPLRQRLGNDVLLACVGPVTAAPLANEGLPYVAPERARTGALVRLVTERLPMFHAAQR